MRGKVIQGKKNCDIYEGVDVFEIIRVRLGKLDMGGIENYS